MSFINEIKSVIQTDRDKKTDIFLSVMTTLISGIVIILSISPEYLHELNPLTLLLVSVACALPVWAFNQLLWWYLGRLFSGELIGKIAYIFEIPEKGKKLLSLAISMLMKTLDVARFIPSQHLANLLTIISIYLGAAIAYFTFNSPAFLYAIIFLLSLIIWLFGLLILHRESQKIDMESLRETWDHLVHNEELIEHINQHVERIEKLIQSKTNLLQHKRATAVNRKDDSA